MPSFNTTKINLREVIQLLSEKTLEHMQHIEMLVSILTKEIDASGFCLDNVEKHEYKYFGAAAFYHDIGKVRVPIFILEKQDKLTPDEVFIMRRHPIFARELFDAIDNGSIIGMPMNLIRPAFSAAVYHHERWDGKGYPYGIEGEKIPLIARITSVCDAYDAMTSKRLYRDTRTHDYACRELEENAGTQFDPKIVQIFMKNA